MVKIFSLLILVYSLFLIGAGLYGLPKTSNIANSLDVGIHSIEELKSAYPDGFDSSDWKIRWISRGIYYLLFGILGLINSIGLMRKFEWSRKFFLAQISIGMFIEIIWYISGLAKYTWEIVTILDLSIYAIIVFASWLILCKKSTILEFKKYT